MDIFLFFLALLIMLASTLYIFNLHELFIIFPKYDFALKLLLMCLMMINSYFILIKFSSTSTFLFVVGIFNSWLLHILFFYAFLSLSIFKLMSLF